jgi:DNA-directed RNA polymerase specialized sigma24 family protein
MPVCVHQIGIAPRKQQQLRHPEPVEAQIHFVSSIRPLELFQWTTGHIEPLGPIRGETLMFLILNSRFSDDHSSIVNDLATIIVDRIKSAIRRRFCRQVPEERMEAFCSRVSQLFWIRALDHEDATAAWAQVSFWPFVMTLARGLLKRDRFERETFLSLESDLSTHAADELPVSDSLSVYDAILIDELLQVLTPIQRRAFILRYYQEFSLLEIGGVINRTERSVHNILIACEKRLQPHLD